MDSTKLHQLVLNPQKVSEDDLSELQELIQNYPYFQTPYCLIAKANPTKEHIRMASVRTSHRASLKKIIKSESFSTQEWDSTNMPDFHPEEDINAFEKLSDDNTDNLSFDENQDQLLQTETNLDFDVDDSPIFSEEGATQAEDESSSNSEGKEVNYDEANYEHPEYTHVEDNAEEKEAEIDKPEENKIEEIDISDFDDYEDPNEDVRNELLETLASFEKNKQNIAEEYRFDKIKEEQENQSTSEENKVSQDTHFDNKAIDNNETETDIDVEFNDEPDEFFATEDIVEEQETEAIKPQIDEPKNENVVIDDSYFDLNNYLDEEIEKPDKKKSLVKKLRYSDTHQKQSIIIDSFVKNMPAMPAPNTEEVSDNKTDLSLESVTENDDLITEQLALIFQKQQKTKKAIYIYEKLMLKYPNKKTYFALQIEKLKKDI